VFFTGMNKGFEQNILINQVQSMILVLLTLHFYFPDFTKMSVGENQSLILLFNCL
jgi:hypothetical protein